MATISTSPRPMAARNTMRPMRPKPLIPTLIVIFFVPFAFVRSGSSEPAYTEFAAGCQRLSPRQAARGSPLASGASVALLQWGAHHPARLRLDVQFAGGFSAAARAPDTDAKQLGQVPPSVRGAEATIYRAASALRCDRRPRRRLAASSAREDAPGKRADFRVAPALRNSTQEGSSHVRSKKIVKARGYPRSGSRYRKDLRPRCDHAPGRTGGGAGGRHSHRQPGHR